MIDPSELLFRCHRISDIMSDGRNQITDKQLETIDALMIKMKRTEKQEEELARLIKKRDNPEISVSAKTYSEQLYLENKYNRKKMITSKYLEKGLTMEEHCLTLLSLTKKIFLKKNTERISNKFLTGEPDAYVGESVKRAKEGHDVKAAWELFTMPYWEKIDPKYEWQDHGYIALTGAERWTTSHCLVNAPPGLIVKEKLDMFYRLGVSENSPEYKEKAIEIERNMIFDMAQFKKDNPYFDLNSEVPENPEEWEFNIPLEERIVSFVVERDNKIIESIYERVMECREYIKTTLINV